MKESVERTLFFISLLLSRTMVTENPIDVHPHSTLLNFFPALSAILANMRSHGSSLKFIYSFPCLITACVRCTRHFDSFEAPNRARRLLTKLAIIWFGDDLSQIWKIFRKAIRFKRIKLGIAMEKKHEFYLIISAFAELRPILVIFIFMCSLGFALATNITKPLILAMPSPWRLVSVMSASYSFPISTGQGLKLPPYSRLLS